MNKTQYLEALEVLLFNARKDATESEQERMIDEFEELVKQRLEFESNDFEAGYTENLIEEANSFFVSWRHENNIYVSPIEWRV